MATVVAAGKVTTSPTIRQPTTFRGTKSTILMSIARWVRSSSNRVSFNGGHGGLTAQPTSHERQFAQENHTPATSQQQSHFQQAAQTRSHQVKVNNAVAGNGNATHQDHTANNAGNNHDAAFTGGDTHVNRTAEASHTATAANTHNAETHMANQHHAAQNPQVASTPHIQHAQTHVAQASVQHPAQHINSPVVSHQASAPHIEHASAPHMSASHASAPHMSAPHASAPHASAPHAGGGGHSGGGAHASSGGNKH